MEIKQHTVGDNNIFVEETIPQKQTYPHPVVLVHASFGGYWMWNMIAPILAEGGFHTYALSLRGHKPSGGELTGAGMSDYEQDVADVVSEFTLKNPTVIGHSLSGLVVLMFARDHETSAVVSIDPSPSLEVQGAGDPEKVKEIPDVYTPMDAGMPGTPEEMMKALPDISSEMLMKMKDMLGPESGQARRDRKVGISVPKGSIKSPLLIMGAELGDSVKFGISLQSSQKMAEYYGVEFEAVKGATHPGMVMGEKSGQVADHVTSWLKKIN